MKTIVGLFDDHSNGVATVRELETSSLGRDNINIIAGQGAGHSASENMHTNEASLTIPDVGPVTAAGPLVRNGIGDGPGAVAGGFISALAGAGVPAEHARYYAEGVRRGGTLVVVTASDSESEGVMDVMNRHHPVDIEDRAAAWRENRGAGAGATDVGAFRGMDAATESAARAAASTGQQQLQGEQRFPVVEEQLHVGKREVDRGGVRVETRMEETPVEEQLSLREEHVRVERRPADRPVAAGDVGRAFVEGTIEVTERAEEPVVEKEARVVEEVVVGKEASERTETVRDTVRRTDVEIRPVEVGNAAAEQTADFANYESDFRTNFQTTNRGSDYGFEQAKPAYRYGYELASDRSRPGDWSSIEPDARTRWEQRNPGTWDKFKDAARYAYDRARSKVK
jgi:uncharacterized protein (TIGR02271 family)